MHLPHYRLYLSCELSPTIADERQLPKDHFTGLHQRLLVRQLDNGVVRAYGVTPLVPIPLDYPRVDERVMQRP